MEPTNRFCLLICPRNQGNNAARISSLSDSDSGGYFCPPNVPLPFSLAAMNSAARSIKECYELSLSLIERAAEFIAAKEKGSGTFGGQKYPPLSESETEEILAALLPWLRGQISQQKRFVGTIQTDEQIIRFVNSQEAGRLAALGTSCPDHFLRTKIKPLYV